MNTSPSPAPNKLVRLFVTGLPLGIIVMATLSFIVYFHKRNESSAVNAKPSKFASMLRKDINAADIEHYQRVFKQDIGERSLDKAENMDIAASYIESTMGFDNMGYQVIREGYRVEGKPATDLIVQLNGAKKPDEIVLVVASYSGDKGDPASAIAGLMALAHRFTGTEHARTLRLVAQAVPLDSKAPRSNIKAGESLKNQTFLVNGAASGEADVCHLNGTGEALVKELNALAEKLGGQLDAT